MVLPAPVSHPQRQTSAPIQRSPDKRPLVEVKVETVASDPNSRLRSGSLPPAVTIMREGSLGRLPPHPASARSASVAATPRPASVALTPRPPTCLPASHQGLSTPVAPARSVSTPLAPARSVSTPVAPARSVTPTVQRRPTLPSPRPPGPCISGAGGSLLLPGASPLSSPPPAHRHSGPPPPFAPSQCWPAAAHPHVAVGPSLVLSASSQQSRTSSAGLPLTPGARAPNGNGFQSSRDSCHRRSHSGRRSVPRVLPGPPAVSAPAGSPVIFAPNFSPPVKGVTWQSPSR